MNVQSLTQHLQLQEHCGGNSLGGCIFFPQLWSYLVSSVFKILTWWCETWQSQERGKDQVYGWMKTNIESLPGKNMYILHNQVLGMLLLTLYLVIVVIIIIKSFMCSCSEHWLVPLFDRWSHRGWHRSLIQSLTLRGVQCVEGHVTCAYLAV